MSLLVREMCKLAVEIAIGIIATVASTILIKKLKI